MPVDPNKKQLNLWVSIETDAKLRRLAPTMHLRGRTQVAEYIIETFLRDIDDENGGERDKGGGRNNTPPDPMIRKKVGRKQPDEKHKAS